MRHRDELYRAILGNGTDLSALVRRQEEELQFLIDMWEGEGL
jgi:hypothetical protein